MVGLNLY